MTKKTVGQPVTMLETATFDEILEELCVRFPEVIVVVMHEGKTAKDPDTIIRRWKGTPQSVVGHIEMLRLKVLAKINEIGA